MFDLGDPGDTHAHAGGKVFLSEAGVLAGFGELVSACFGQEPA
ncbi:hypothetical protein GCM10023178_04710 [Actinomadura luteofluorescens]